MRSAAFLTIGILLALPSVPAGAAHRVIHTLPNTVSVSYAIWTLPIAEAEQFRKAIDDKKLGALTP